MSKVKSILLSAFQRVTKLLWGTGIGNIPVVCTIHGYLFKLLWSKKTIVEVQGSKMYVNPEGLSKSYTIAFQAYIIYHGLEELTTQMFKKVVKKGDIVVDLGANLGYYTLLAAKIVGEKGKVYAFEPEPTNYSLLLKNIEINGYDNVIAVQKAVSNVTGKVRFFIDKKDIAAHTIYQSCNRRKFIEVESIMLDEFFGNKKHAIDVIKMDMEGAEMAALSGMDRIITENETLKIFLEFSFTLIKRSGGSPEKFAHKLLEDYHFSIFAISEYTKDKKYQEINSVDQLMSLCAGGKTVNLLLSKSEDKRQL